MISTDGGITAPLYPLHLTEFGCFDLIDEEDTDDLLDDDKSKKPETVFDGTTIYCRA